MFITGNSQMINPGTIYNLMATYLISIYQTETIDSTALLGFSLFSFIFMTVPCVFFTEILITTQYVFLVQGREYNWHCWTILISLGGGGGRKGGRGWPKNPTANSSLSQAINHVHLWDNANKIFLRKENTCNLKRISISVPIRYRRRSLLCPGNN